MKKTNRKPKGAPRRKGPKPPRPDSLDTEVPRKLSDKLPPAKAQKALSKIAKGAEGGASSESAVSPA